ncbi:MAG: MBL fold metallo-hydrolase [Xenococcaceae cyanobacterium MO_167.B52]|nr:MBL fold metallo-hydrolase [Xenococcaceae cyanobacterium MO_167.B52]
MPQNSLEINGAVPSQGKPPRLILPGIFAFSPNRDTLGGTAYFIVNKSGNILVDSPGWYGTNQDFLLNNGGVRWLVTTHRGGMGKQVAQSQELLQCEVITQEQEAYLLPEVKVTSFASNLLLTPEIELIWTPGHSPGSACLYWNNLGGVLFSGRHLLPTAPDQIMPLRTAKTFHWWRQLRNITKICDRFDENTLKYIIPGANTGLLRGKGYIEDGYQKLAKLDMEALKSTNIY